MTPPREQTRYRLRSTLPDWTAASTAFESAIVDYHVARRRAPDAPNVVRNVETNTVRIPRRGDRMLATMAAAAGSTAHAHVVDVGCGFGALAMYIAWKGDVEHLSGIDVRQDLIDVGRQVVNDLGLGDQVEFRTGDMRNLVGIGDATADLVLANGVLMYLQSLRDVRAALHEFHRVLRPGGALVTYQNNRWRWRDPFSGARALHLLPRPGARAVGRLMRSKFDADHARLMSPLELARRARRAGFGAIRIVGYGEGETVRGLRRLIDDAYALSAVKPRR